MSGMVGSLNSLFVTISPILNLFKEWRLTSELSIKNLTAELCWLLEVTEFLRASDIHPIDDARSRIGNGTLSLVIIAPKEKRGGCPVKKPCEISSYTDPLLCPVNSIASHIHSILRSITKVHDTPIPKGRAIGATLAARSGVSSNDIITHAFWSNYSMFDSYYRLPRSSTNNLESILPLE